MREYKNRVLSSEHAVTTDVFCSHLQRALKKLDNMSLKAFKAYFEVLFKLYNNLKELTIGKKECHLIFFNSFTAKHQNTFLQHQKEYHKMTIDKNSTSSRTSMPQTNCFVSNFNVRLLQGKYAMRLTKGGMRNVLLLERTNLQASTMTGQTNVTIQKTFDALQDQRL